MSAVVVCNAVRDVCNDERGLPKEQPEDDKPPPASAAANATPTPSKRPCDIAASAAIAPPRMIKPPAMKQNQANMFTRLRYVGYADSARMRVR
jgi:hypothetical protein